MCPDPLYMRQGGIVVFLLAAGGDISQNDGCNGFARHCSRSRNVSKQQICPRGKVTHPIVGAVPAIG